MKVKNKQLDVFKPEDLGGDVKPRLNTLKVDKPATLNTVTAALACGGEVPVLMASANPAEAVKAAAQTAGVTKFIAADSPSLAENFAENVAALVPAITGHPTCRRPVVENLDRAGQRVPERSA